MCHLSGVGVVRVALRAGRRRAALPGDHAEPAARSRSQDREQPSPRRLPRLLRRRAAAALHSARTRRRDLFDPCPRLVGDGRAGVCHRRLPRGRSAADRVGGVRQRAGLAPRRSGDAAERRRLVRLGCGHVVGDGDLPQLQRLSRRSWRRDRADRRVGDPPRRRGARLGRDVGPPVAPARRGAGPAAVDAQPVRAPRRLHRRAGAAAAAADEEPGGQGGGFSQRADRQRGRVAVVLLRDLWPTRSVGALRLDARLLARLRPRRPHRPAVRSAFRAGCQRAGAAVWIRRPDTDAAAAD